MNRVLVWFSCGAASAVAAKIATKLYPSTVEILYCDTLAYEHPDNKRFLLDVGSWLGHPIKILSSPKYKDIYDVFIKTRFLVGVGGARCTQELKRNVRKAYERPGDRHIFGFTSEEGHRIDRFDTENPLIQAEFPLYDRGISKSQCFEELTRAGIELPMMYRLGYKNNNCIGCVKGQQGYWNKIRVDFPEAYERMAKMERELGVAINKYYVGPHRVKLFLDEMKPKEGNYESEGDMECGVLCISDDK